MLMYGDDMKNEAIGCAYKVFRMNFPPLADQEKEMMSQINLNTRAEKGTQMRTLGGGVLVDPIERHIFNY